ncbi:TAT-variant-translocated molybdopterin oxidoreductase [Bryobacter aggregatus]|uniref:TAT-variant-translocated molybdopterin oxidoreductase n=1 Tax=Bryobacter aggregatus TaxID=360054 RepID=UPI000567C54E|nr:TAT-variant-translocated molybdopterin oxidoreductase [Bryobacter aggregatus]
MPQELPQYWRSLEELAKTEEFRAFVEDEFPNRTPDWNDPGSRRRFLTLMGASIVMAGATGCTVQPKEAIVPYVRQPENFVPGNSLFYATAATYGGIATGLLVESQLGRPTKIEGNPLHPASLGATDAAMQASILTLYDPDRSQAVIHRGNISTWGNFVSAITTARETAATKKGEGLRLLTGTVTSLTLAAQIQEFLTTLPSAKWHQYEACGRHSVRAGALAASGQPFNTIYRFDRANVIVSLDADFLSSTMPGNLRYTRDYSARRRAAAERASETPPRLYVAEGTPSIAGGMAEHRLRMRSCEVEAFAAALYQELKEPSSGSTAIVRAIAKDLQAQRGASILIAGEQQPAKVHVLAHAINQMLGNAGKTVLYTDPVEAKPIDELQSLRELVKDMSSGAVETLLVLGGNPVYDAPADLNFLQEFKKVKTRVHLGLYADETAAWSHWHLPAAHFLESWSDARAYDGTVSILQPLIAPIYGGKTSHELLNVLEHRTGRTAHDTVRDYWQGQHPAADFQEFWQRSLHDGVIAGSAFAERTPPIIQTPTLGTTPSSSLEIVFRPDPAVGDGSLSNNAWLQEMPKPQNKMTWDNAVWISPKSAQHYGVTTGDVVELQFQGRKVKGPIWMLPGHADESLTVHFGYGRTRAGKVANGIGFNAYALRPSTDIGHGVGASLTRISSGYPFATTQHTQTMEERDPFRAATFDDYHQNPEFANPEEKHVADETTLFPLWEYKAHKWGMSIDLTACTGCHACTIACQSENNISVVGKAEVSKGRHMNWLRVDRYYQGSLEDPATYYQPVPCMHCENAPCELVCPVAATVHSAEGLNEMVYNRCVGTRYCSNNCPYKVRRFNFLLYADWDTKSLFGARNPDVSVRSRGVMEKCSYCVQRITEAKIESEKRNQALTDGEIVTACQQVCPAQAIVFGDLNDPKSRVSQAKREHRNYGLLEELNTRPRTTYLARLRNPNPDLEKG